MTYCTLRDVPLEITGFPFNEMLWSLVKPLLSKLHGLTNARLSQQATPSKHNFLPAFHSFYYFFSSDFFLVSHHFSLQFYFL